MTLRKPPRYKQLSRITTAILIIAFLGSALWIYLHQGAATVHSGSAYAVDGDSLRLGSTRLRILGMDAPEYEQTCQDVDGGEWPCGLEARDELAALIANGDVLCTSHGRDRYGRLLADCEIDGIDVGARMVEQGWAISDGRFQAEESAARAAVRGVWRGNFVRPEVWRQGARSNGQDEEPLSGLWDRLFH